MTKKKSTIPPKLKLLEVKFSLAMIAKTLTIISAPNSLLQIRQNANADLVASSYFDISLANNV